MANGIVALAVVTDQRFWNESLPQESPVSLGTPFDDREVVRQATDIVDLVGSYIPLEHRGRLFVGLCPWHDDSRPSLQVNRQRQQWKCWVCNIGGDCFDFVMQREGVDFRQALEILADRAGVTLSRRGRPEAHDEKVLLFKALAWAQGQFHSWLLEARDAEPARAYLAERGIEWESIERFALGASPPTWQWLLDRARSTPFNEQVLESAGLVLAGQRGGHYDRFRGRLLFPIRDEQSRTVAFGGRVLPAWSKPDEPKYVNSPESRVFSKHRQLYALDLARDAIRKAGTSIVVEGYTDAVMAHQHGLTNVVAVLGTALGEGHVRILQRYADTVCLLLDGDAAGQRRANEILDLFIAQQLNLRVATLPGDQDPADILRRDGADGVRKWLATAPDALDHKLRVVTRGIDLDRDTHQAHQALEQMLATLAKSPAPSGAKFSQQLRQQQVLARLASTFRVDEQTLRNRITELRRPRPPAKQAATEKDAPLGPLPMNERELLELLIDGGEIGRAITEAVDPSELKHPATQQLIMASREIVAQGRTLNLDELMLRLEDPQLKFVLVDVADAAEARAAVALADRAQRFRDWMTRNEDHQAARRSQQVIAKLESRRLDEEEEKRALLEIIEQQRSRQGISAPTDG